MVEPVYRRLCKQHGLATDRPAAEWLSRSGRADRMPQVMRRDARERAEFQFSGICDRARTCRPADADEMAEAVVLALGVVVEIRDQNTEEHCQRLARHATATGAYLGLGVDDLRTLFRGGYLHDLGKIAIPDCILLKRGPLTPEEFSQMKHHPAIGDQLCRQLPMLDQVRPIVRSHHERLDGSGYPDGLRGDRIPVLAQLIAIADVFDAMTSVRPYKTAQPAAVACEALMHEVKKGWRRRDLVTAFIEAVVETGSHDNAGTTVFPPMALKVAA